LKTDLDRVQLASDKEAIEAFIAKWRGVAASELSTAQSFAIDLCNLLDVAVPHATAEQDYMFERPITFAHGDGSTTPGRIDLYRRGAFVWEAKKVKAPTHTKGFDDALLRARSQAERYARALPAEEGRPPFLAVVDVGNRIELYSEFSRSGATYTPFPDPRTYRITLEDLRSDAIRDRLRNVWLDPLSLDPSRASAKVTREIAAHLAELAKSLERANHAPEVVAQFLMRCVFTMFAEDVKLLPADSFLELLKKHVENPDVAMRMLGQLWRDMDGGGFSAAIASDVLRFNGKLFKQPITLPLDHDQIRLLIEAAEAKWEHVEPAIFGTLLERALNPSERHKLGAHYTPRAYVERLVLPTVIEPLRAEWSDVQAATLAQLEIAEEWRIKGGESGKAKSPAERVKQYQIELRKARDLVLTFHKRLCNVRVLDPACGSGNFLYVTLEHLKRLEGEVLNALAEYGINRTGLSAQTDLDVASTRAISIEAETVDPHQLLGIELNPRAAAIAEVVLWIGYLQWHYRTRGDVNPPQPVIRDFHNIETRDAVLAYDHMEYVTDQHGVAVTRWDGKTMKKSPITGEDIPDDSVRLPLELYVNPRKAAWPQADFVVGNPPFIGSKRMRDLLGDGYVDAIQAAWPEIPQATDFVMRWWHHAALLARNGALRRFGLITTNSLRQIYVRRAVEPHLAGDPPLSLTFAIPDHPWVDNSDGAAVRIAMTAGEGGHCIGKRMDVIKERTESEDNNGDLVVKMTSKVGIINADLSVGLNVTAAKPLLSNQDLCSVGMKTIGSAFQIDLATAQALGLNTVGGLDHHIRPYINGRDFAGTARGIYIVDFFGLDVEEVRERFPAAYQHLFERAKPKRDENRNKIFREKWWAIGHPRQQFRRAITGIQRYIATIETAKHRFFAFVPVAVAPDSTLVTIASNEAAHLGTLSSIIHRVWVDANAGSLGVYIGNVRYNKSTCFEPFPFPSTTTEQQSRIREIAERLDLHRRRQQATHPGLTLTGMYNLMDKLRSGEPLTAAERVINEHGLLSVLRQFHDDLDATVLDAYNWDDLLQLLRVAHGNECSNSAESRDDAKRTFDETILERLLALNLERATEESRGLVRWLRPDFQNASAQAAQRQVEIEMGDEADIAAVIQTISKPLPWPKDAVDQVRAVAAALAASITPQSVDELAERFTARGGWKKRLPQLLDMLVAVGRASVHAGRYAPA
jgi:hypothetical protein